MHRFAPSVKPATCVLPRRRMRRARREAGPRSRSRLHRPCARPVSLGSTVSRRQQRASPPATPAIKVSTVLERTRMSRAPLDSTLSKLVRPPPRRASNVPLARSAMLPAASPRVPTTPSPPCPARCPPLRASAAVCGTRRARLDRPRAIFARIHHRGCSGRMGPSCRTHPSSCLPRCTPRRTRRAERARRSPEGWFSRWRHCSAPTEQCAQVSWTLRSVAPFAVRIRLLSHIDRH
jgi:hypothetical protein